MALLKTRLHGTDTPIPDIDVRIADDFGDSNSAKFNYQTDLGGNQSWPVPEWTGRRYTLHVNQQIVNGGYNDQYNPRYGSTSLTVKAKPDGSFDDVIIGLESQLLDGEEAGWLHIHDRNFMTDQNQYWQFRGYSSHYLPNCAAGSPKCDPIDDVLSQITDYGYNTIVSVGMHASPWKVANGWAFNPVNQPEYFRWLGHMFDKAEDHKVRVAHAPLADMQHYTGDKQHFWRESCAVMAGRWNVLPRKGNEDYSNGWHPAAYQFPDGMSGLLSQGSRGEGTNPRYDPYYPYLDWVEYEVIRKAPKMFLDLPLRQIMDGDFAGPATNRPTVNIEPMFFADTNPDHVGDARSTDPRVAREMALMMGACAGGAFGCSLGLECRVLPAGSISDQCARAFIQALKAVFIRPLAALDFQGDH